MKKDLVDTFYGPPKEGVYSPSVQNTLYLMAKSVLNRSLSFSLLHTHMHTHTQISINTNTYPHSHIDSQVQTHMHMHSHADTHAWACIIKILPLTHMLVFVWYTQTHMHMHSLAETHAWACIIKILSLNHMLIFVWSNVLRLILDFSMLPGFLTYHPSN